MFLIFLDPYFFFFNLGLNSMLMVSKDDVFKSLEYNRELIFFNFLNSLENIKRFSFFYSNALFNFFCEFKKLGRKFAFIFHKKNFLKLRRIYFFQDFFLQFNLKMHWSTFLFNAVLDKFFNSMFSKFLKEDEVSKPLLGFKDFSLDKEILSPNSKNFFFLNMMTDSNFILFKKIQTSFFSLTKHKQFILNDSFIFKKIAFFKKSNLKVLKNKFFKKSNLKVSKNKFFKKSKVFLKSKLLGEFRQLLDQNFEKYERNFVYKIFFDNWNKKDLYEIERSISEEKDFFLKGLIPKRFLRLTSALPGYSFWFRKFETYMDLKREILLMQLNKLPCLKRLSDFKELEKFKLDKIGFTDIHLNNLFKKVKVLNYDELSVKLKDSYTEFGDINLYDPALKEFSDIMEYLFHYKLLRKCKRFLVKLKKLERFKGNNEDLDLKEFERELLKFGDFESRLYHANVRLNEEKIACFEFINSIPVISWDSFFSFYQGFKNREKEFIFNKGQERYSWKIFERSLIPEGLLKKLQLDFLMFANDVSLSFYKRKLSERSKIEFLKSVVSLYGDIQDGILNKVAITFLEEKEAKALNDFKKCFKDLEFFEKDKIKVEGLIKDLEEKRKNKDLEFSEIEKVENLIKDLSYLYQKSIKNDKFFILGIDKVKVKDLIKDLEEKRKNKDLGFFEKDKIKVEGLIKDLSYIYIEKGKNKDLEFSEIEKAEVEGFIKDLSLVCKKKRFYEVWDYMIYNLFLFFSFNVKKTVIKEKFKELKVNFSLDFLIRNEGKNEVEKKGFVKYLESEKLDMGEIHRQFLCEVDKKEMLKIKKLIIDINKMQLLEENKSRELKELEYFRTCDLWYVNFYFYRHLFVLSKDMKIVKVKEENKLHVLIPNFLDPEKATGFTLMEFLMHWVENLEISKKIYKFYGHVFTKKDTERNLKKYVSSLNLKVMPPSLFEKTNLALFKAKFLEEFRHTFGFDIAWIFKCLDFIKEEEWGFWNLERILEFISVIKDKIREKEKEKAKVYLKKLENVENIVKVIIKDIEEEKERVNEEYENEFLKIEDLVDIVDRSTINLIWDSYSKVYKNLESKFKKDIKFLQDNQHSQDFLFKWRNFGRIDFFLRNNWLEDIHIYFLERAYNDKYKQLKKNRGKKQSLVKLQKQLTIDLMEKHFYEIFKKEGVLMVYSEISPLIVFLNLLFDFSILDHFFLDYKLDSLIKALEKHFKRVYNKKCKELEKNGGEKQTLVEFQKQLTIDLMEERFRGKSKKVVVIPDLVDLKSWDVPVKNDRYRWGRWGIIILKEILKKVSFSANPPTCLYDFLNLTSLKDDIGNKLENIYGYKVLSSSKDMELICKRNFQEILKYIKQMKFPLVKLKWPVIVLEGYFRIISVLLDKNREGKETLIKFQKQLTFDFSIGYLRKLCEGVVEIFTEFPFHVIFPGEFRKAVEIEIFTKFTSPLFSLSKFLQFKIFEEIFWDYCLVTSQNTTVFGIHEFFKKGSIGLRIELREKLLRDYRNSEWFLKCSEIIANFVKYEYWFTRFSLIKSALVNRMEQQDEKIRMFMGFRRRALLLSSRFKIEELSESDKRFKGLRKIFYNIKDSEWKLIKRFKIFNIIERPELKLSKRFQGEKLLKIIQKWFHNWNYKLRSGERLKELALVGIIFEWFYKRYEKFWRIMKKLREKDIEKKKDLPQIDVLEAYEIEEIKLLSDEQKKIEEEIKLLSDQQGTDEEVSLLRNNWKRLDDDISGEKRGLQYVRGRREEIFVRIDFLHEKIIKLGGFLRFLGQKVLKKNKIIKMRKLIKKMRMTNIRINEFLKYKALFDEKELALTARRFLISNVRLFDMLFFFQPFFFFSFFKEFLRETFDGEDLERGLIVFPGFLKKDRLRDKKSENFQFFIFRNKGFIFFLKYMEILLFIDDFFIWYFCLDSGVLKKKSIYGWGRVWFLKPFFIDKGSGRKFFFFKYIFSLRRKTIKTFDFNFLHGKRFMKQIGISLKFFILKNGKILLFFDSCFWFLVSSNQSNVFFKDDIYLKADNFFFPFILEDFPQKFFLKIFEKKNELSLRGFFSFLDLKKGFFFDSSKFFFPFSEKFSKIKGSSRFFKPLPDKVDIGYMSKEEKEERKKRIKEDIPELQNLDESQRFFMESWIDDYVEKSMSKRSDATFLEMMQATRVDFFLNYFYKQSFFQSSGDLLMMRFFKDFLQVFELKKRGYLFSSFIKFFWKFGRKFWYFRVRDFFYFWDLKKRNELFLSLI